MREFFRDKEIRSTLAVFALVSVFILATFFTARFPWAVFAVTFGIASVLIVRTPRAGLFTMILLTMIWERFFTLQSLVVAGRIVKLYPLDIVLMMTFCAFVAVWLRTRRERKLLRDRHAPSPSFLPVFGAFEKSLVLFALLATVYFFVSQVYGVREPEIAFSTFKNYAFYMLLTVLVLGLLRTAEDMQRCVRVLLAGGVGILVFLVIGFVRGEGLWTEFTPLSTEGVRYLAFPHAYYLLIAMLFAVSLLLHRFFRHPRWVVVLLGAQFVGLLVSLMRHLWLAFIAGMFVLAMTASPAIKRRFFRWGEVVLGVLFAVLLCGSVATIFFPGSNIGHASARFLDPLIARVTSFGKVTQDLSAVWRLKLWQTTAERFSSSPFFGIGFGQEITFDLRGYVSTIRVRDLHNSFFGVLVQMGIVGFGFFAAIHVALILAYRRGRHRMQASLRPFIDGACAAYVAFLVAANFQPYLETNILGVFFWLLIGIIRIAPALREEPAFDWSHLRHARNLRMLESTHRRGAPIFTRMPLV